jgi:pectate lyase
MTRLVCYLFFFASTFAACTSSKTVAQSQQNVNEGPLAFPGADGYGRFTKGGRGGRVIVVSNLNDKGPGSLRDAVEGKSPRIVVFAVSGTIHLESKLDFLSDLTVAGQTAPGGGICLADFPVFIRGNNIIVRYLRFRMGDKNQRGGMVDGNGGDDAFGGTRKNNIIVDHCSLSWSTDEVFSIYAGDSTTLSWNLIAEPMNYSYHFESGDKDYEHHGYGAIWGGKHLSAHHNLFAHCNSRTPRFDGIRNSQVENVDYRNNVIYDWGENNVYAGEGGNYNIINNYYKWGPSTKQVVKYRIVNPYKRDPDIPFGKFYLEGNYVDGASDVTANNWKGLILNKGNEADMASVKMNVAFPAAPIHSENAREAYESVLKNVGAILPQRDTLDQRIINEVKNRTGRMIDVQGGYLHGTAYDATVNAWPMLVSAAAPKDSDQDGMPDDWEVKNGLNPNDASDATGYKLDKQYTNVEVYLNSLTKGPTS